MTDAMLELSEHELYFLPPGTPATAPATRVQVEVDGELRVFLARLIWENLIIRQRQHYAVFYRAQGSEVVLHTGGSVYTPTQKLPQEEISKILCERVCSTNRNRLWHPPDASWQASFYPHGSGSVCWREGGFDLIYFRWEQSWRESEFLTYSNRVFHNFCEQLRLNENSPLSYVLSWHELTPEQKSARAFSCENGDWEELRRVFTLAFSIVKSHDILPVSQWSKHRWQFDLERSLCATQAHAWLQRWRAVICGILRPLFWFDEPECHKFWRHYPTNEMRCKIIGEMPTAHEFLEAQLELRDFLRPHLPADEIEALFVP